MDEQTYRIMLREYNTLRNSTIDDREALEKLEDKWFGESAPLQVPLKIQDKMEALQNRINDRRHKIMELRTAILAAGRKI